MPLTLRPTGLQTSAAFAHLADWSVYDDGRQIGRLREEHGFRADLAHSAIVGICKACSNVSSE